MALKYGITAQNAKLDQLFVAIGASPKLRFYDGLPPANAATAPAGTQLAEITLPATPMAAAAAGSKAKSGTWQGNAAAGGNIQYFRMYDSAGAVCHIQGSGGTSGADMIVSAVAVVNGQQITVNTFTITEGMT